jgi:molybdate transport system regulatory protein
MAMRMKQKCSASTKCHLPKDIKDINDTGPMVKVRAWLEWNGQSLLGKGRLALLEGIEKHGSISAAARDFGLSYRAAWNWITEMNTVAPRPLVEAVAGGKGGGGAALTPLGRRVLTAFHLLNERLMQFNDNINHEVRRLFENEVV